MITAIVLLAIATDDVSLFGQLYPTNTTVLSVHERDLGVPIPSQLALLTDLRMLDLVFTHILGDLPPQFYSLTKLSHIVISGNPDFAPPLSTGLLQFTRLHMLLWQSCGITSPLPTFLGEISTLVTLGFGGNRISGTIPSELGKLTNLRRLLLDGNQLTGTLPSDLGRLQSLRVLFLSRNYLEGSIPSEFASLSNLSEFVVFSNRLSGTFPALISNMNLQILWVQNNLFTGTLPSQLGKLSRLVDLSLSDNELEGTIPTQLGRLSDLSTIVLSGMSLSGTLPSQLALLTALSFVIVHDNKIGGTIPPLSGHELVGVTLHNNYITGAVPRQLIDTLFKRRTDNKTLTLAGNFLSCMLPDGELPPDQVFVAFVAPGNAFDYGPPDWVPESERSATFLFISPIPDYAWFLSTIFGGVVVMFLLECKVMHWNVRSVLVRLSTIIFGQRSLLGSRDKEAAPAESRSVTDILTFYRRCCGTTGSIAVIAVCLLMPCYWAGSNLYECGKSTGKLTIAYLTASHDAEMAAAAMTCLYGVFVGVQVRRLWHFRRGYQQRQDLSSSDTSYSDQQVRPLTPVQGPVSKVFRAGVWVVSMMLLNVPVVMYLFLPNLPDDNSLHLPPPLIALFQYTFPLLLALISDVVIPVLCKWVVTPWASHEMSLLVVSRLLTVIVLPFAVALLVEDGCFALWTRLWRVCSGSSQYDIPNPFQIQGYFVTTEEICHPSYRFGRCSRRVVSTTTHVIALKLAVEATVRPIFMLLVSMVPWMEVRFQRFVRRYLDVGLRASVQAITWIEIAVVYGYVAPLVAVLAWITLGLNYVASELVVERRGQTDREVPDLPLWYLPISLVLQCLLACWFFVENALSGGLLVLTVTPVVCMACLVYDRLVQLGRQVRNRSGSDGIRSVLLDQK